MHKRCPAFAESRLTPTPSGRFLSRPEFDRRSGSLLLRAGSSIGQSAGPLVVHELITRDTAGRNGRAAWEPEVVSSSLAPRSNSNLGIRRQTNVTITLGAGDAARGQRRACILQMEMTGAPSATVGRIGRPNDAAAWTVTRSFTENCVEAQRANPRFGHTARVVHVTNHLAGSTPASVSCGLVIARDGQRVSKQATCDARPNGTPANASGCACRDRLGVGCESAQSSSPSFPNAGAAQSGVRNDYHHASVCCRRVSPGVSVRSAPGFRYKPAAPNSSEGFNARIACRILGAAGFLNSLTYGVTDDSADREVCRMAG